MSTPTPPAAPDVAVAVAVADGSKTETSIRVDVGVLDKLMNLVGEMVLTRNQILELTGPGHPVLTANSTLVGAGTFEVNGEPIRVSLYHRAQAA